MHDGWADLQSGGNGAPLDHGRQCVEDDDDQDEDEDLVAADPVEVFLFHGWLFRGAIFWFLKLAGHGLIHSEHGGRREKGSLDETAD